MSRSSLSSRMIENLIRKQVNKALHDAGMNPSTRRGNKELKHLIGRLAQTPIADEAAATELGITLGQQILEVSEQKGKKNLDQGVVIQVIAAGNLPVVEVEPVVATSSPAVAAAESEPVAESGAAVEDDESVAAADPDAEVSAGGDEDTAADAEVEAETTADSEEDAEDDAAADTDTET